MKTILRLSLFLSLACLAETGVQAQTAPAATAAATVSPTQKMIEAYLRHLYAFGPDVPVTVGPTKETAVDGVLETTITVLIGENKETVKFYVSKDGKYLFRGEMSDMTKDPLAETRAQIQMNNVPVWGDAKAPVTIVEYSDFECPVCKNLHDVMRELMPKYQGKVRVLFKDYPLEQLHPWARTAAIAGRCAYQQDRNAFWKIYDLIYDNQEIISASTVWTKMTDYAEQLRLDSNAFKACMAGPEAGQAVNASRANGQAIDVNSTPTVFVNGRRMVGADAHLLEQYINYELDQLKLGKTTEKK